MASTGCNLDHGDGWVTYYIHLETLPNLTKGQAVAQGEQIGRTGASGTAGATNDMHIHYTQLKDGNAVRIAFDGKLIGTHAANEDSYNTYGDGEELTSRNCSNDSILRRTSSTATRTCGHTRPASAR